MLPHILSFTVVPYFFCWYCNSCTEFLSSSTQFEKEIAKILKETQLIFLFICLFLPLTPFNFFLEQVMGLECCNQPWLKLKGCREVGTPIGSLMSQPCFVCCIHTGQKSFYLLKLCFKDSCTISDTVKHHFGWTHIEGRIPVRLQLWM